MLENLKVAVAYTDADVKTATRKLIDSLESDLREVGFEPSPETETALAELEEAINNADEAHDAGDDDELEELD